MIYDLSPGRVEALHEELRDEIATFGYTEDVTPRDWLELELAAVKRVYEKCMRFCPWLENCDPGDETQER